ncbi:MAG: DUF1583 domain-containing protein [Planctomycetota bacterium]|nr:MAG: DUF1583 domain-containing protein [Planctomycetota bacterium]
MRRRGRDRTYQGIARCALAAMLVAAPALVAGQVARTARKPADPADASHAERCVAAIDLAVVAAESGIVDVSMEAMRRATQKGPPVANLELGGLLGKKPVQSGNPGNQPTPTESAQSKLASRLQKLHAAWKKHEVDPVAAYEAFKLLVFPPQRPSEAFVYGESMLDTSRVTYSNIELETEPPKLETSGAGALVEWAQRANRQDNLLETAASRASFPSAADAVLLVRALVAQDPSRSLDEVRSVCETVAERPQAVIGTPEATLLFGHVYEAMKRLPDDAPEREKAVEAILAAMPRQNNWSANEWLLFFVCKAMRDAVDAGDAEGFDRYAATAMSRYDSIRANNVDYVARQEAGLYAGAVSRAFAAGRLKLAADFLRKQNQLPGALEYLQSQGSYLLDPERATMQTLLALERAERYELLKNIVWKLPDLGLAGLARMNATDRIPPLFAKLAPADLPWHVVDGKDTHTASVLEWTMRDAIALGKQAEIEEQLKLLVERKSDNARLARAVYDLAQDKPIDLAALAHDRPGGRKWLLPSMGRGKDVVPLDLEVVEQSLDDEEYRKLGQELLTRLKVQAISNNQPLFVSLTRELDARAKGEIPEITQSRLAHWVVADDVEAGSYLGGHVPETLWVQHDDKSWGHQFGTDFSMLMLRYPLQGNYTISFRYRDGGFLESAAELSGRVFEFLGNSSRTYVRDVGFRSSGSLTTDQIDRDAFNDIRLERKGDELVLRINDDFDQKLEVPAADFPFFALAAHHYRRTTVENVKIEGDVTIPRQVDMLSPGLVGWSGRFKGDRLPRLALLPDDKEPDNSDKSDFEWWLADGVLESVEHEPKKPRSNAGIAALLNAERPPRERLIQYMRPLCNREQVALEFYYEPGKFTLAPALGRIAMLLEDDGVALHWITADPAGLITGIDDQNRIVDETAEQPNPVKLKANDWNQLTLRMEGDVAVLAINNQEVYRRTWEPEAGRVFGLFRDPTQFQVRVRGAALTGPWPEQLPEDLFELKSEDKVTWESGDRLGSENRPRVSTKGAANFTRSATIR